MLRETLEPKRFFITTNATAVGIALAAALANVFVGPFNPAMWLMPIFILGFAAITLVLVQAALSETERPPKVNWMVRRIVGKRLPYYLHQCFRWEMRILSPVFLYIVPSVFLITAALLLILAVRGQITLGS